MRYSILKCIVLLYAFSGSSPRICGQNSTSSRLLDSVLIIHSNSSYSNSEKLNFFYHFRDVADKNQLMRDSVYASILFEIGYNEAEANSNYYKALGYISEALKINTGKNGSKLNAARCSFNLGVYYNTLGIANKAIIYYDSTIKLAQQFPDTTLFIARSKIRKAYLFLLRGDYQKAIEESIDGMNYALQKRDSAYFLAFYNQKTQALYYSDKITAALSDANIVMAAAKRQNNLYEEASAIKFKALILKRKQQYPSADPLFKKAINLRIETGYYNEVANDYIDYGNFYLDSLNNYKRAKQCYLEAISWGQKANDSVSIARANTNIQELYLEQDDYKASSEYCLKALSYLNILIDNIYENPQIDQLNAIAEKEMVLVLMNNKIETLLKIFTSDKTKGAALDACLQTCLITDAFITNMRHTQSGNESKLYWRDYTRDFYENAIAVSYLLDKPGSAFDFMERSRAVLLNDKINELDASSYLSPQDATQQEYYEIAIVELQQKLSMLSNISKQYKTLQLKLIKTRDSLDHFIKSLEQKYPAYYQYKYSDEVPSLKSLQQYLAKNKQNFVHYFFGDTVTYILAITPTGTIFKRLKQKELNKGELSDFLQMCANKEMLNNHYDSFVHLSNSIYKTIFQHLSLPAGRIVICTDNIVIPFDAICTDETGKHFLLNNYSFNYVYSARSLMKQFNSTTAEGNFAGFAPVSFNKSLNVVDLKDAAGALEASASYYKKDKLFIRQNASRKNFFNYAPSYSIVSIFSHAFADTTDNEPVLFMQDASIHLSELQLLKEPSTKLVLLSACQTNVGRAATGEGIYSLARGFAAAGIPSVAATLWKADEQTIYAVSKKFNEYLSAGMNKDESLQKAKLYFIQNNGSEKMLPYYWANMILIGNTDAIGLTTKHNNYWWWIGGFLLIAGIIMLILKKNLLLSKIKK